MTIVISPKWDVHIPPAKVQGTVERGQGECKSGKGGMLWNAASQADMARALLNSQQPWVSQHKSGPIPILL